MMTANRRTSDRRRNGAMIALVVAVGCLCVVLLVGFVEDRHLRAHDGKQAATVSQLRGLSTRQCIALNKVINGFNHQVTVGEMTAAAAADMEDFVAKTFKGAQRRAHQTSAQKVRGLGSKFSLVDLVPCK